MSVFFTFILCGVIIYLIFSWSIGTLNICTWDSDYVELLLIFEIISVYINTINAYLFLLSEKLKLEDNDQK